MSFWRRSLGRAAIMVLQAAATRGLGVVSSALLARLLTPTDWGSLQAVSSVASTMNQTLKLSLDGGLQIRLSETERDPHAPSTGQLLGAGLLLTALTALVAIVLGACFGDLTARLFGDPALVPFMGLGGVLAAGQLLSQIGVVLLAFGAFGTYAAINAWVSVAYVALLSLAFLLDARGLGVGVGALGCMQVSTGLLMLVFTVRAFRSRGIRVRLTRLREASQDLLRVGMPLYLASTLPSVATLFVNANLARVTGLSALATLRVIASLNQLVSFVPAAFAQTFITQFAGARGAAAQVPTADFLRYLRLIVAGGALSAVSTAVCAPWVVLLIFGREYSSAARLVALGVMTTLLMTTKQALLVGLLSERRTSFALLDAVVVSSVFTLLSALLTKPFGVTGLLLSDFGSQVASLGLLLAVVGRRFVQPELAREAYKTLLGVALALAALLAVYVLFDSRLQLLRHAVLLLCMCVALPVLLLTADERAALVRLAAAYMRRGR